MTNECEDCDSIICRERGCDAPVNKGNKIIDWSKPIETNAGVPAELLKRDFQTEDGEFFNLVLVRSTVSDPGDSTFIVNDNGEWGASHLIRNRKVKREGWVNIYKEGYTSLWFNTKAEALARAQSRADTYGYITTVRIEWDE